MTVRQLIAHLLEKNGLDDEIIVEWWDKDYFINALDITEPHKLDELWEEFVKSGKETVSEHLEFTQTGHDLANDLQEMIQDRESCGN